MLVLDGGFVEDPRGLVLPLLLFLEFGVLQADRFESLRPGVVEHFDVVDFLLQLDRTDVAARPA